MKITLRGKEYQAEHLTDINILPLAFLTVDENHQLIVSDAAEFETLPQATKLKLLEPLMDKLTNVEEKSKFAQSISAIFPSIPTSLVSYSNDTFKFNLTIAELMAIAIACGNELQKQSGTTISADMQPADTSRPVADGITKPETRGFTPRTSDEGIKAKLHRILELEAKLDRLEKIDDFPGLQVEKDKLLDEQVQLTIWLKNNSSRQVPTDTRAATFLSA